MKIKEFMSKKVMTVHKEMNVKEFIQLLEQHNITGAPVADESGKVIGVISATDVIERSNYINKEMSHCEDCYEVDPTTGLVEVHKYYTEELFEKQIGCLMTKDLITLSPENDLMDAIDVFLKTPVHRIIILDKDKLVGIISTKDTIKAMAGLLKKQ